MMANAGGAWDNSKKLCEKLGERKRGHKMLWLLVAASPALRFGVHTTAGPVSVLRMSPTSMIVPVLRAYPPAMQLGDPAVGIEEDANTQKFCGGAVPFAPIGSGGGGSTASRTAMSGMTGAAGAPQRRRLAARSRPSAGSLVDKKNAIAQELGLSGDLPTVAASAAKVLGIDLGPNGKTAADIIHESHHKLFEE